MTCETRCGHASRKWVETSERSIQLLETCDLVPAAKKPGSIRGVARFIATKCTNGNFRENFKPYRIFF